MPVNNVTPTQQPYYLEPEKPSKSQSILKGLSKNTYRSIQIFVLLGLFCMVMYLFVTPGSMVDGPSMQPNFCNNDIYLTNRFPSYFSPLPYEFGDVIAFKLDSSHNLIKRVIGLPGDTLSLQNGKIFRNGTILNEVYLQDSVNTDGFGGGYLTEGIDYTVPEGKLFVIGDNRDNSIDSRDFGPIDPYENPINGSVFVILWPLERAGLFDKNTKKALDACGSATIN